MRFFGLTSLPIDKGGTDYSDSENTVEEDAIESTASNRDTRQRSSEESYDCDPGFYTTPAGRSESEDTVPLDEKFIEESKRLPVESIRVEHVAVQQISACDSKQNAGEKFNENHNKCKTVVDKSSTGYELMKRFRECGFDILDIQEACKEADDNLDRAAEILELRFQKAERERDKLKEKEAKVIAKTVAENKARVEADKVRRLEQRNAKLKAKGVAMIKQKDRLEAKRKAEERTRQRKSNAATEKGLSMRELKRLNAKRASNLRKVESRKNNEIRMRKNQQAKEGKGKAEAEERTKVEAQSTLKVRNAVNVDKNDVQATTIARQNMFENSRELDDAAACAAT